MPRNGGPTVRLPLTPASPPKKPGNISEAANTISPRPSVIIANGVPALRVVSHPNTQPNASPARPPTSGSSETGTKNDPLPSRFIAWIAKYAPNPEYTAWPKLSMPLWPSSML